MDDLILENYPPITISRLSSGVLTGNSNNEDGIILMRLFCEMSDQGKEIPNELIKHFSKVFKIILAREKLPNQALGIKEKSHPNHPSEKVKKQLAFAFLLHRVSGMKIDAAYDFISTEFGWQRSAIYEAWNEHKEDARKMFQLFCHATNKILTETEQKNLNKILKSSARQK